MNVPGIIEHKKLVPKKPNEPANQDKSLLHTGVYKVPNEGTTSAPLSEYHSPSHIKRKTSIRSIMQEEDQIIVPTPFRKSNEFKTIIEDEVKTARKRLALNMKPRNEKRPVSVEHKPKKLSKGLDGLGRSNLSLKPKKKLYREKIVFQNQYISPAKQTPKRISVLSIENNKIPATPKNERIPSCVWVSDEEELENLDRSENPILVETPEDTLETRSPQTRSKETNAHELPSVATTISDQHELNNVFESTESKSPTIEALEDKDCSVECLKGNQIPGSMLPEKVNMPPNATLPASDQSMQYTPCTQKPMMSLECLSIGCKYYSSIADRLLLSYDKDSVEIYHGCDQLVAITLNQITALRYYSQASPYLITLKTKYRLKNEKFANYYDPEDLVSKKNQILCFCKDTPDMLVKDLDKFPWFTCEPLSRLEWDKLCGETISVKYEENDINIQQFLTHTDTFQPSGEGSNKITKPGSSILRSPRKSLRSYTRKAVPRNRRSSELFFYPFDRINALAVTSDDVYRLSEGEFLNDTLVEFYMRYIHNDLSKKNLQLSEKIHFFNPFFYHRLTQKDSTSDVYERVKKWTSKIDLFEKDFIFVPINENLHWYLALICFPALLLANTSFDQLVVNPETKDDKTGSDINPIDVQSIKNDTALHTDNEIMTDNSKSPWIIVFDSLNLRHESVFEVLNTYLHNEAKEKKKIEIRQRVEGIYAKVPCQTNHCDCGVYLLQYVETFLNDTKKYLDLAVNGVDNTVAWFSHKDIKRKREEIRDIICKLSKEYQGLKRDPLINNL
ncbi:hypothetical protein K7432_008646 [Basidiobolus ranarum]|uniref:Ubiquitin-like protease family profile domain-containing protein n=1 Tax=Basidiobolus ranarum TaxID=34480 RepID=A0ABR2WRI5_9FUNG